MKFGLKLETYAIPEWSDKYLRYNELKKFIKKKKKRISQAKSRSIVSGGLWWRRDQCGDTLEEAMVAFSELLEAEMKKVEDHFHFESAFLDDRLEGVSAEVENLEDEEIRDGLTKKKHNAHKIRLQRTIVSLWDCYEKLEAFVQLNHLAVYKILKKRDKELHVDNMTEEFAIFKARFETLQKPSSLKARLDDLCRRTSKEADGALQSLSAAVNRHFMLQNQPQVTWVAFFLGACSVLLLDLIVCSLLPARNELYTSEALVAIMPIYRLMMMIILAAWGAAVCVYFFENYGVNYKFLLDIDPRSDLKATHLFKFASEATALWIVGIGLFVFDFKFGLFGPHHKYWLHPLGLILVEVGLFVCGGHRGLKEDVMLSLKTTCICGFVISPHLTLAWNLFGDILTSMAKPLGDLEYSLCYYSSGLFHTETPVTCSFDRYALPLFTAFPFWIRFMQCFSRYREGKYSESVHLGNMVKYLSSILVIVATNVNWQTLAISIYARKLIFVFVYLWASIYSMAWDFVFDWGLVVDADNFLRTEDRRMYPEVLYYSISMLNIFGRLTWALTLTPITDSANHQSIFLSTIVFTAVAVIEIVRRSAWALLRLENEHLNNSSKYRALLWIPRLCEPAIPDSITESTTAVWARLLDNAYHPSSDVEDVQRSTRAESGQSTHPPRRRRTYGHVSKKRRHDRRTMSGTHSRPSVHSPVLQETYWVPTSPTEEVRRVDCQIAHSVRCVDIHSPERKRSTTPPRYVEVTITPVLAQEEG